METCAQQCRNLIRSSYLEGALYAVMVGTAESFALFFAVKHEMPLHQLALLSTVPILLGSVSQWLMPLIVPQRFLRFAKLSFYLVQILGLIFLCLATQHKNLFPWLFAALSLYWVGGLSAGPFWLEWIAKEVPSKTFGAFLSKRNAFVSFCTLLAYVSAAFYLNLHAEADNFLIVFGMGSVARFGSFLSQWTLSSKHIEWRFHRTASRSHKTPLPFKPIFWMMALTVIFKFAVSLSSPFFLPFMVQELHFGIFKYVALTSIPFVGRFLFLEGWGRASSDLRPFVGVQISCIGIAFIPALWASFPNFWFYILLELFSGMLWGGFELCTILIIQRFLVRNTLPMMGLHMSLMSASSVLGALYGSRLMEKYSSYETLFMISSASRMFVAAVMVIIFLKIPATRTRLRVYSQYLSTVLSLRPSLANVGRMIWARRR
jgi:hypothetical protein